MLTKLCTEPPIMRSFMNLHKERIQLPLLLILLAEESQPPILIKNIKSLV